MIKQILAVIVLSITLGNTGYAQNMVPVTVWVPVVQQPQPVVQVVVQKEYVPVYYSVSPVWVPCWRRCGWFGHYYYW